MTHSNQFDDKSTIMLGIDYDRRDEQGGIYCLYESADNGNSWEKATEDRSVCKLLEVAGQRYAKETPLVLTTTIEQVMRLEIMEEREKRIIRTREVFETDEGISQKTKGRGIISRMIGFLGHFLKGSSNEQPKPQEGG